MAMAMAGAGDHGAGPEGGSRQAVLRALARRGVASALRERDAIDRELVAAATALEPPALAWNGPPAQVPVGARERIAELQARRAAVAGRLEVAFAEVAREVPPFEIAGRVEAIIDRALRDPCVGRVVPPEGDALPREIEGVAWRVIALFAPGTEVAALAARALADPAFTALRAAAQREVAEARAVATQLSEAEDAVPTFGEMYGGGREERRRVNELARVLSAEQAEANQAFESAWLALVRAVEVKPALRVHTALLAAGAVLRSEGHTDLVVATAAGSTHVLRGAQRRVMFLAALADLRHACDRAFPGLGVIASGGPGGPRLSRPLSCRGGRGARRVAGSGAPGRPAGGAPRPCGCHRGGVARAPPRGGRWSLKTWTADAHVALGPLPPAVDALCRYVQVKLTSREGLTC